MATVSARAELSQRVMRYRHNVYAFNPLLTDEEELIAAPATVAKIVAEAPMTSAGFALPIPASVAKAQALESGYPHSGSSHEDDGASDAAVSEVSDSRLATPVTASMLPAATAAPTQIFRYASVNFRFGSAWFLAPFRTHMGDMVVVQYPGNNNSTHMGLVTAITTVKPATFYSDDNVDPNFLTAAEIEVLPRLLRHARDFDRETKFELRDHDLHSLANARAVAKEMGAMVEFLDAEWLLDLSAVTFLVHVYDDAYSGMDQLADELASREGAEVVFTYPSV